MQRWLTMMMTTWVLLLVAAPLSAQAISGRLAKTALKSDVRGSDNLTCEQYLEAGSPAQQWFVAGLNEGVEHAAVGVEVQLINTTFEAAGADAEAEARVPGLEVASHTLSRMLPDRMVTIGNLADSIRGACTLTDDRSLPVVRFYWDLMDETRGRR